MTRPKIMLGLQGGGAHGAYAWGVLDALLEADRFDVVALSGTSAGAMNAAMLCVGLVDGAEAARAQLAHFWRRVGEKAAFSPIGPSPLDRMFGNGDLSFSFGFQMLDTMTRLMTPGQMASWLNPLKINPLRDLLVETVDFDAVKSDAAPLVLINATNIMRGTMRIFDNADLSVDALLASAAVPFLFKPPKIEGERYWDGGYVANPPIAPLIDRTRQGRPDAQDLIIVQVTPFESTTPPRTATEIFDRMSEIAFNALLARDLCAVALGDDAPRLHLVSAETAMRPFTMSSKLNADRAFIEKLFALGRSVGEEWLDAHGDAVGKRGTFDPSALAGLPQMIRVPA